DTVFDELCVDAHVALDRVQALTQIGIVRDAPLQQLRPPEDGAQRRAQLVRERRQKFVLDRSQASAFGARGALALEELRENIGEPRPLLLCALALGDVAGDFRCNDYPAASVLDRGD